MHDNYKQNNRMEGKHDPRVSKGWVVKWQRALVTPFCDATATGTDDIFAGKNDMTWDRHIHIKRKPIKTRLTYFLSTSGGINLHDDSC